VSRDILASFGAVCLGVKYSRLDLCSELFCTARFEFSKSCFWNLQYFEIKRRVHWQLVTDISADIFVSTFRVVLFIYSKGGKPGSNYSESMWEFWWKIWYWDRILFWTLLRFSCFVIIFAVLLLYII